MRRPVESITGQSCQVDATDKCKRAVDDHELFVMAVHRAIVRVERSANPRPTRQSMHQLACLRARRLHDRRRRPRPDKDAHVNAIRRFREQIPHRDHCGMSLQGKPRVDRPTRDVHEGSGAAHRRRYRGQRRCPIHVHPQSVPVAHGRLRGPSIAGATQCAAPAGTRQTPEVMTRLRGLDDVPRSRVKAADDLGDH